MEVGCIGPRQKGFLKYAWLSVTTVALVFFILDLALKSQFYSSGAAFIETVQTSRTTFGDVFFGYFSDVSLVLVLAIPALHYLLGDPQQGFKGVVLAVHIIYLTDILKLLYSEPRPYWKYSEVDGVRCSTGWGNPSGHASLSMGVLAYYSLIVSKKKKHPWLVWSSCAGAVGLIGLDRIYLGVHFYSQILIGWLLALSLSLAYACVDPLLDRIYNATLNNPASAAFWSIHAVLCSAVALLIYYLRDPFWSSNWSDNIDDDCTKSISKNSTESQSSIESTVICFISGAAVSLNLCSRFKYNNWLRSVNCRHSTIKVVFVGGIVGSIFLVRMFLLPEVPTSTGKFFVSTGLTFCAGVLCNFSILAASLCAKTATPKDERSSPQESLNEVEEE